MSAILIKLTDEMHQDIKIKAAQENKTIKAVVTGLIEKWLKGKRGKENQKASV